MNNIKNIRLPYTPKLKQADIPLPSSKSESNRALIINALSGGKAALNNLSEARDTQTMIRLLQSGAKEMDVLDAGTTMRFLTAYFSVKGANKIMTGTPRMKERPIKILVDALRTLGVEISYLGVEGYPPHEIQGFGDQKTAHLKVPGDVSSQYISALLMIAPELPQGLTLELTGTINSRPYIEMTLSLMRTFGAQAQFTADHIVEVKPTSYIDAAYSIESDWSGASYWYSWVALAEEAEVKLLGLRKNSLQGDIKIAEVMAKLGVSSKFTDDGVILTKIAPVQETQIDFSDCPDLAQTVTVICAVKGITCHMTGLESLRIKETDRIAALQNELAKISASLVEHDTHNWTLVPCENTNWKNQELQIHTYDDHRMAMAFAPLATQHKIIIESPEVVNKSYPSYWDHLRLVGVKW